MTVHKFYLLKFTSDIINFSTTIHNANKTGSERKKNR